MSSALEPLADEQTSRLRFRLSTRYHHSALLQGLQTWLTLELLEAIDIVGVTIVQPPGTAPSPPSGAHSVFRLEFSTTTSPHNWLVGLQQWSDLGLLAQGQLVVDITSSIAHAELLAGLQALVDLELLSLTQLEELCRSQLTCLLPPSPVRQAVPPTTVKKPVSQPSVKQPVTVASPPKPPSPVAVLLQSLMAELSVRWLLFLGVFLVIVSSGVLAANQWQQVAVTGQYLILFVYTLVFWATSQWASRQSGLTLTAQTLSLVTLLLVPINFWAMDTFNLWQSPLNWVVIILATAALSGLTWQLFQTQPSPRRLPLGNHLGLSLVHWGWGLPGMPLLATYVGILITAVLTVYQLLTRPAAAMPGRSQSLPPLRAILVIASLLILLGRAVFVAGVPATQLGLALGLCGSLMVWLDWQYRPERLQLLGFAWEPIGLAAVATGLLVAWVGQVYWQALLLLGLAGWLVGQRLGRSWRQRDLLLLLAIGFQATWCSWLLVPTALRDPLVQSLATMAGVSDQPIALLSVAGLPGLAAIVILASWFTRLQRPALAQCSDLVMLGGAIVLGSLSVASPSLQTLTFAGLAGLVALTSRRSLGLGTTITPSFPGPRLLILLAHGFCLISLLSGLYWFNPALDSKSWAIVLLIILGLEWGCLWLMADRDRPGWRLWGDSTWYFGLALAAASYGLFLTPCASDLCPLITGITPIFGRLGQNSGVGAEVLVSPATNLAWLMVPISLTLLASRHQPRYHQVAAELGLPAVLMAQTLTLGLPGIQLIGLGSGLVLMVVLTNRVRQGLFAAVTVGLGLAFCGVLLLEGRLGLGLTWSTGLIATAIALATLWAGRLWLFRYDISLAQIYGWALDGWAILLCSVELVLLLGGAWQQFGPLPTASVLLTAGTITMVAPAYRSWHPPRQPASLWWSIAVLSLTQLACVGFSRSRLVALALATVLMLVHTRLLRQTQAATVTVGYGLFLLAAILWDLPRPLGMDWLIVGASVSGGLWLLREGLRRVDRPLALLYLPGLDGWGIVLWLITMTSLSIHSLRLYMASGELVGELSGFLESAPTWQGVTAAAVLTLVLVYRTWKQPADWSFYSLAWSVEVLAMESLSLTQQSLLVLAIANVGLGLSTQLLGDWWHRYRQTGDPIGPSLSVVPLIYATIGGVLRQGEFTSWTGLLTVTIALVAIGIGKRRSNLKPLIYLGMIGVSLGLYECLLFQLLQTTSGKVGDGFIALAALGTTIVYGYRLLSPWLQQYLGVLEEDVKFAAHAHWGLSSVLLAIAATLPVDNYLLWFSLGGFLVRYAFFQGRHQAQPLAGEGWVWLALCQLAGLLYYGHSTPWGSVFYPAMQSILVAIACLVAYLVIRAPWIAWGWSPRPLLIAAISTPLIAVSTGITPLYPPHFLVAASFYGVLAWERQQIRYSYLTVALLVSLLWCWLHQQQITDPLGYSLSLGLCLLYGVHVEPSLRSAPQRPTRFSLRLLGTILICGIPLLQQTAIGLVPAGLGLAILIAGLALRIRAYLLVGAATFLLTILYQLGVLVFDYPLTKWILGLLLGIALFYIGATFETRREQTLTIMRQWLAELNEWE